MSPDALMRLVGEALADGGGVPEPARPLVRWFTDLHRTRTYHAAGPNPITFAEIEAYIRLSGQPLQPHHVSAIRDVDDAWIALTYKKRSADRAAAAQPMTLAAFDARF